MNSAATVANLIAQWKTQGLSKAAFVVKTAEACLGWPYVWGGAGQLDTPANRRSYAERSSCPAAEAKVIRSKCRVLSGSSDSCSGCKWYPNSPTRFFDCRGFTRWCFAQVGITIDGAGATSQWNNAANWSEKGDIKDLPAGKVCCVFMRDGTKMSHTGIHIGGGQIIHCSGEVKRGKTSDKGWTNYAIPKGMEGDVPVPDPGTDRPTLRRGSKGEYVTLLQTKLIQLGYDLSPYGADGSYGAKTEAAVRQFQTDSGLKADGICGKNTWAALDAGKATLYTVTIQHVSKSVADDIVGKYGGVMAKE